MSEQEAKKQILKSTGILGSAQLIIIVVGVIRVKILAVLLGAAGVGIAGLYQTTIDLVKSLTGFGIGYSAVRDIAASAASKDERKIASTILVLRRLVWLTGLFGMLVVILFSPQLSYMAFGDESHAKNIAILSVALLFSAISSGQSALLRGYRRIGDMAKSNVLGAILGLLGAVVIYYFWGVKGIIPALLLIYVTALMLSWYFSRKITTIPVKLSPIEIFRKGKAMVSLGIFMSLSGLASTGTMYIVRAFLSQEGGLASVGHFVAAWSISSMYISAIFSAMGADFFPRLSAVQQDSEAVTNMVNEQTEVAILLTAPIIIGMVSFIDLVVWLFYSKDFSPTAKILDWQLLGDFFKVLVWPAGFIILAKGKGNLFMATEFFWNLLYCIGVYFGWHYFGIEITGISFFVSYILYLVLVYVVAKNLVSFSWSSKVLRAILVFLPLLLLAFLSVKFLETNLRYFFCAFITISAVYYSYSRLIHLINIKAVLQKLGLLKK